MAAELHMTFNRRDAMRRQVSLQSFADVALKASARFWFLVTIAGQLLFAFTIASFYGRTALRGDLQVWNRFMFRGYVPGDRTGNFVVALHLGSAVVIILAGAVQFVPQIRKRFPVLHRWTGVIYMLTALTVSASGLYMHWVRGTYGDLSQRLGATLNAVLIWLCVAMALRYALARDFKTHRRWVLRLFLVVSAAWFFRAAFFLSLVLFKGPVGFDPHTFQGPFLTVMSFAQSLFPLAVLEFYFRAQERGGAWHRLAIAASLLLLTVATGAGIFSVSALVWLPNIRTAYEGRKSMARTVSPTISSDAIEQAVKKYRDLRNAAGGASPARLDMMIVQAKARGISR